MPDWQFITVLICIAIAGAFLVRRVARLLWPRSKSAAGCGGCHGCNQASKPEGVVSLGSITPRDDAR